MNVIHERLLRMNSDEQILRSQLRYMVHMEIERLRRHIAPPEEGHANLTILRMQHSWSILRSLAFEKMLKKVLH